MNMAETGDRLCPLSYTGSGVESWASCCERESCEWWVDNRCAVVDIADRLTRIAEHLQVLALRGVGA